AGGVLAVWASKSRRSPQPRTRRKMPTKARSKTRAKKDDAMERRSEAQTGIGPWLEYLAWNAAAGAALAVMLLVLLASLEWLDALTTPPIARPSARERASEHRGPVIASERTAKG